MARIDHSEPGGPQPPGAGEVPAVPAGDHRQRRDPGARTERLPGRIQGRRPHAPQQVPHLLDLAASLGDQLLPAGSQVPQPAPRLIHRLRDVAAQLRGQPGDQHHILLISLVRRQVLGPPRLPAARTRTASIAARPAGPAPATGARSAHTTPSLPPSPSPQPALRPSPAPRQDPRRGTGTSSAR